MILQALDAYYRRLAEDGEAVPEGFTKKEIPFLIVLDRSGCFRSLQDTRNPQGKKMVGRMFLVPRERERSGSKAWQVANLLWDNYGYLLGWPKSDDVKHIEMAQKQHSSFVGEVRRLSEKYPSDPEIAAVLKFLDVGDFGPVTSHSAWSDCSKIPGCNLTFMVEGFDRPVCGSETLRDYVASSGLDNSPSEDEDGEEDGAVHDVEGLCLVSGNYGPLSRLHPRTPIYGSKSNAKLVSFQKGMGFDSYGKEQGYNAPIGQKASFAFSTSLSRMLAKDSRQKLLIGDATTVFWAGKKSVVEDLFADLFGEPAKENPDQTVNAIRALYTAPATGTPPLDEDYTPFYVLGLSPNAARLSVRFWHPGTVGETVRNIKAHFDDCRICRGPKQPEYLSLFRLLSSVAVQGKSENVPQNLAGDFMKSILAGVLYPRTVLALTVTRCRAERDVPYPRASLLKAILSRHARLRNPGIREVGMSLDTSMTSSGYLLGRLFSVLEKIQEEANPGINATIRDRFYGGASGTPVVAFHHLMKLKNHHLAKLDNRGRAVNMERLIGEIVDKLPAENPFPAHLSLDEQGRFAVGYYHQRQAFFAKSENSGS
jgi:CRISPR-associated protein Csd1